MNGERDRSVRGPLLDPGQDQAGPDGGRIREGGAADRDLVVGAGRDRDVLFGREEPIL